MYLRIDTLFGGRFGPAPMPLRQWVKPPRFKGTLLPRIKGTLLPRVKGTLLPVSKTLFYPDQRPLLPLAQAPFSTLRQCVKATPSQAPLFDPAPMCRSGSCVPVPGTHWDIGAGSQGVGVGRREPRLADVCGRTVGRRPESGEAILSPVRIALGPILIRESAELAVCHAGNCVRCRKSPAGLVMPLVRLHGGLLTKGWGPRPAREATTGCGYPTAARTERPASLCCKTRGRSGGTKYGDTAHMGYRSAPAHSRRCAPRHAGPARNAARLFQCPYVSPAAVTAVLWFWA